jgi:hypothetical protein
LRDLGDVSVRRNVAAGGQDEAHRFRGVFSQERFEFSDVHKVFQETGSNPVAGSRDRRRSRGQRREKGR